VCANPAWSGSSLQRFARTDLVPPTFPREGPGRRARVAGLMAAGEDVVGAGAQVRTILQLDFLRWAVELVGGPRARRSFGGVARGRQLEPRGTVSRDTRSRCDDQRSSPIPLSLR
jgi:hypothetical protein